MPSTTMDVFEPDPTLGECEFMEPRPLIFKGMPEAKERKASMESEIKALEEKLKRKKERFAGVEEELKA